MSLPPLPDASAWSFSQISDPVRRARLEEAPSPSALVEQVRSRLESALDSGKGVHIAWERRGGDGPGRAVVQFAVGAELFDWLFNARTGYRAHYRAHYKTGLRFNNMLVAAIGQVLEAQLPEAFVCREMGWASESGVFDLGEVPITKAMIMQSLECYVSKVWCCNHRFLPGGGMKEIRPDYQGPKIVLGNEPDWVGLIQDDDSAWIEVKGRFIGLPRWDQGKHLIRERAKGLAKTGTA